MTDKEKKSIMDLKTERISKDQFFNNFPLKNNYNYYVLELLRSAKEAKNADDLYYAFLLGFTLKSFDASFTSILNELLLEDWHFKHEDIADLLKILRSPDSVEPLFKTATRRFNYLSYDNSIPLMNKCLYALFFIHTNEAKEKIIALSKIADNDLIREEALEILEKWDEE